MGEPGGGEGIDTYVFKRSFLVFAFLFAHTIQTSKSSREREEQASNHIH